MKPIIVYRLGSLGDTVVAIPCFHQIRASFPDRKIIALTNIPVSAKAAPLVAVLGDAGFIDEAISYPVGLRDPIGLARLAFQLRALGADTLVHLQPRTTTAAHRDVRFFQLCGFKYIIGAPVTALLAEPIVDAMTGEEEFEASRLTRCLRPLGSADLEDPASWDLKFTEAERRVAKEALTPLRDGRFLAVNTGGKDPSKDWGRANWIDALALISAELDMGLVFVGAPDDRQRASDIAPAWRGPTLNLCGKLSPRETGAVLQRATAFAGHDSGPLHLAAAAQTPCVGLYGGLNKPRRWHPYGRKHTVLHEMEGVGKILPTRAADAVMAILNRAIETTP